MTNRTILIVDDERINRRILAKLLSDEYTIMEAVNGQEAMDLLKEHSGEISAVLLDIVMPVMDGHAVLAAMAKDPVLSKIPVIVSSQRDGDEAEIKALSLGAQDFIAKPYKAEIIRRRLSNMIRLRETAALINKAEKDELTGLYNKQFFIENVSQLLKSNPGEHYDLFCLGVERFKLINETFGPQKGDELLRYIAKVISSSDAALYVAHFSADLFFSLTKHHDHYPPELFGAWYKTINEFPISMDIKMHCGIYELTEPDLPVSVMCDRAQLAADMNKGMYDAPYFLYDDKLRNKLLEEQFITSHMRNALEEHQYQVYYQPKYDLLNEQVAGAEALVRWIHPEKGFLSPGAFIPLFERNGFITELDQYVWETACRDIRRWIDKGYPPVAVSVNVSRADIYNPQLPDILSGLLAKYEIPIRYLHLEITESAYTDNPEQIIVVVNQLRALGFVIEMDDFGSGYSSLNMLAEMPVDVLKLDMHFIQSETSKSSGKGILSFVISLAKWLDLAVVAEGVETGEQIATLRSMDCNYVQGFYYAKPMKLQDFENLLETSKTTEMICTSQTARQYVAEAPAKAESTKAAPDKNERKILVVDDIDFNRAILVGTFESEYTVIEKENGLTAWEYLDEHYKEIEIVLLDLLMPVMDGFQLLDKIRADERMRDLPVIITSQGDANSEQRALQMQADDFLSKPYNPDIIRHRVRNVIASHEVLAMKKAQKQSGAMEETSSVERAFALVEALKPHFDIVRLVEPNHTLVCRDDVPDGCEIHACFTVWGKATRCNNCISLKALKERSRHCKLEYSKNGLYFVISEYIPFGTTGAVIEMVTKLDDDYVDNVFDKKMLYANLDMIHQQLDHDELTGIYNRRFIDKRLNEYISSAKTAGVDLGLAMIDVDNFKLLNDTYGHLNGDKILKSVATILQVNVSVSKGDFAARFGGDEFLIACRGITAEELKKRIENIANLVEHIELDCDKTQHIGISAGSVCLSEYPDSDAISLIDKADRRLYIAKQSGRGTVVKDG